MRTLDQWFSIYAVSHQNPINKKIHYWCVPLIFYSTLAFLEGISRAEYLNLPFSLSLVLVIIGGFFYLQLGQERDALQRSLHFLMNILGSDRPSSSETLELQF